MKKILSLLGTITLIGASTTSLVACNKTQEYTPEELSKLKAENKINTKDENIKKNLEWIAPQETPFNKIDNKYYYVVWRGDKKDNWKMIKFKNFEIKFKTLDKYNEYEFVLNTKIPFANDLFIYKYKLVIYYWINSNFSFFKSVYRWNLTTPEPDLVIDNDGNVKVNGE